MVSLSSERSQSAKSASIRMEGARREVTCFTLTGEPLMGTGPMSKYLPIQGIRWMTGLGTNILE